MRNAIEKKWLKTLLSWGILTAILGGNTAYEAGNINGAILGLEALFGSDSLMVYPFVVGGLAATLLGFGSYKTLEKLLIGLVILLSTSFLITAVLVGPSIVELIKGVVWIQFPKDSLFTIMALIGTTVVPYNLFLHAALVKEKWQQPSDLKALRTDTKIAVSIGVLVSMAIVITATALPKDSLKSVLDLAEGLAPLYGSFAKIAIGIGLLSAGITSAVTAPLAAAYVVNSCFDLGLKASHWAFKVISLGVLSLGMCSLLLNYTPISVIIFAQIANGIILPVLVGLLFWLGNNQAVLGTHTNSKTKNILFGIIFIISLGLSIKTLVSVF
jgi:Mn2+/Fe2+ NRAMP family transporter